MYSLLFFVDYIISVFILYFNTAFGTKCNIAALNAFFDEFSAELFGN